MRHRNVSADDVALMRLYLQTYGSIPAAQQMLKSIRKRTFNYSNWESVLLDIIEDRMKAGKEPK